MVFMDIGMDLQIFICTLLHPSDILTLRKTCKTLQLVTRQRTIWIDALHRVCVENTLFLPSFPVLDMSDVELERAAMAPRRWIELATSYAARGVTDSEVRLSPTATRIFDSPFGSEEEITTSLMLVPGGRYMVGFSSSRLGVWDLGYTSSADCKLIASVGSEGGDFRGDIHATSDSMGLVISLLHRRYIDKRCAFYEIYPESETPQLTKIAGLDLPHQHHSSICVSPDKMVWLDQHRRETIFRIWDYRLNTSVSFLAPNDVSIGYNTQVVAATQTAIVILCNDIIFIWTIPPLLLPQPPNFDDYSSLPRFPPSIRINCRYGFRLYSSPAIWRPVSGWYIGLSKPLYFDRLPSRQSQLDCFKLNIKPDLSDATLHLITTFGLNADEVSRESSIQPMLCEDTVVYSWSSFGQSAIYITSTLSCPTSHRDPLITKISLPADRPHKLSLCTASGRLVHLNRGRRIAVLDFLPHHRL